MKKIINFISLLSLWCYWSDVFGEEKGQLSRVDVQKIDTRRKIRRCRNDNR